MKWWWNEYEIKQRHLVNNGDISPKIAELKTDKEENKSERDEFLAF